MPFRPLEHTAGTGLVQGLFLLAALVKIFHGKGDHVPIPRFQRQKGAANDSAVFHENTMSVSILQLLAGKLPEKDNMWYGTTATTPDEKFFWGGAWHTFVSIEPILRDYSGEIGEMCDTFAQWVIVGAETGNRKGKIIPDKSWIDAIAKTCIRKSIALFMKDSLIPIVGEENMRRELPWRE